MFLVESVVGFISSFNLSFFDNFKIRNGGEGGGEGETRDHQNNSSLRLIQKPGYADSDRNSSWSLPKNLSTRYSDSGFNPFNCPLSTKHKFPYSEPL